MSHEESTLGRYLADPIVAVRPATILVSVLQVLVLLHRRPDAKTTQLEDLVLLIDVLLLEFDHVKTLLLPCLLELLLDLWIVVDDTSGRSLRGQC